MKRSSWLDTLRSTAVLAVVAYHVVQMSPLVGSAIAKATHYGQYGVDLFFVLSGWLIGSLLWQERRLFGDVQLARFWARRAARTVPPYLVMLGLSWGVVAGTRNESFDLGYLLFIQNYYDRIPFFLVSWSLCVEEHFYLVAPVVVIALIRLLGPARSAGPLLALVAASPIARAIELGSLRHDIFGYAETATHLRLDGLAVGFIASFAATHWPTQWAAVTRTGLSGLLALVPLGGIVVVEHIGGPIQYVLLPLLLSLLFGIVVAIGLEVFVAPNDNLVSRVSHAVALCSYSAYLVHPLAIHAARRVLETWSRQDSLLYWPLVVCAIALATVTFYWLIERTVILLRDILVPRREHTDQ